MAHTNPLVFLDITVDGDVGGRVVLELFSDTNARAAENFRSLCTGERGVGRQGKKLHLKGSGFHRVVPGLLVQGGDFIHHDGSGGEAVFEGGSFEDHCFAHTHTREGLLGMAKQPGTDANTSQFYLTAAAAPWLDADGHVVFGHVVQGFEIVLQMVTCGCEDGAPQVPVTIADCGELRVRNYTRRKRL